MKLESRESVLIHVNLNLDLSICVKLAKWGGGGGNLDEKIMFSIHFVTVKL